MVKKNLGSFTKEEDVELLLQFDKYLELINKDRSTNKVSRLQFFSHAIKQELEGRVLTNDYITLEEPVYINTTELLKRRTVYATSEKPSYDLLNQMVLFKIPNNLDSWNSNYRTFCSNEKNLHEGIKPQIALIGSDNDNTIKYFYHVFKLSVFYNTYENGRTEKINSIEVSIVTPEELELFLNQYEEEIAESLLKEFKEFEKSVEEDLASDLTNLEIAEKYKDPSFYRMLIYNQSILNSTEIVSSVGNSILNIVEELKPIAEDISKEESIDLDSSDLVEEIETTVVNGVKSNLNSRNLKQLKEIKENPEHPINTIFTEINSKVEGSVENPEANVEDVFKDVLNYEFSEIQSIKENVDFDFILDTINKSDLNENMKEVFNTIANAESVEEIEEDFSDKIEKKLSKDYGVEVNSKKK